MLLCNAAGHHFLDNLTSACSVTDCLSLFEGGGKSVSRDIHQLGSYRHKVSSATEQACNVAVCWCAFSWMTMETRMKKDLSLKLCRRHSFFSWQNRVLLYSIASTPNLTWILCVI